MGKIEKNRQHVEKKVSMSDRIRTALIEKGASIVAYADLSSIPEKYRKGYRYGIAIGVALAPEIVLGIKDGPTLAYYDEYKRVNSLLDELDEYAAELLRAKGFDALPKVRRVVKIDEETRWTELPHKTVATRAGIGWIGKCALLVTEAYGSAVRISSVLTNAALEVGVPINTSGCGACTACKNICPAGAVSGSHWEVHKDRDEFYNAFNCRKAAREKSGEIGINESLCGICIRSCPWTKKYLRKGLISITGGLELLPSVQPLWEQLRDHHGSISKHFSESIRKRTFADRAGDFEAKAQHHMFRIELVQREKAELPIGYCISSLSNDLIGEVESIFIDSQYRGLDIGDMLIKHALGWMEGQGAKRKRLGVLAGNDTVLGFYEKYGFKVRTYILEQN